MKRTLLAVLSTLLVHRLSQAGVAQLVLYDNFNSRNIDPSKWNGFQFYEPDLREAVRELTAVPGIGDGQHPDFGRRLHMSQRAYSATTDDNGASGDGFGLAFPAPSAITETSFTVVVNKAQAVGCTSNPSQIVTDAEFRGHFFNIEISPTNQIGDIQAVISITRTPTDVGSALTVTGFVERCADQFCGSTTTLDYRVLGYVHPVFRPLCASSGTSPTIASFFG